MHPVAANVVFLLNKIFSVRQYIKKNYLGSFNTRNSYGSATAEVMSFFSSKS